MSRLRKVGLTLSCLATLTQLAACGPDSGSPSVPGGDGNPPPAGPAGTLQLTVNEVSIDESGAAAGLAISRTGGSHGAVTIAIDSADGTAGAGQDYSALSTTVSFAAGETGMKPVNLSVIDDAEGEYDETLTVRLSSPTGGATLGGMASATVTIRDNDAPSAAILSVAGGGPRQLRFAWASVVTATGYRLAVDPDGLSGYSVIGAEHGSDVTSTGIEVPVHLHDWQNARYRLEACSARGCTPSMPITSSAAMLQAIGYLKADDESAGIGAEDQFGAAVALSSDGKVLAVGAPLDDDDFSTARDPGAVYVFAREGQQWLLRDRVVAPLLLANHGDQFGLSVALNADGSTLVVGAPSDGIERGFGAAFVFQRNGDDWAYDGMLAAPSGMAQQFARFGASVAIAGNNSRIIVGAPRDRGAGPDTAGSIFEFVRHPGPWRMRMRVQTNPTSQAAFFGSAVALSSDGNTLYASAPFETASATQRRMGAVYVYTFNGSNWIQQARLVGRNSEQFDNFGSQISVSGNGDTLAVSATAERGGAGVMHPGPTPDDDDDAVPDAGAVYVFKRAAGIWTQHAYLKASNAGAADIFGTGLALSGDGEVLAVGAAGEGSRAAGVGGDESDDSAARAGAAYVFELSQDRWSQRAYVKPANTQADDMFGIAVALNSDGSLMAVGAPLEDSGTPTLGPVDNDDATNAGALYLY